MNKPNCFIVGAPKCGTTALATYLSEHPNVLFSSPKEPFYWCLDEFPRARHEPLIRSLASYEALFKYARLGEHLVIAEGSTRYLYAKHAVQRILAYNPHAKFIVMLRNPVEVAQAYHMEMLYSLHEDVRDFATAWSLSEERRVGRCVPATCPAPTLLDYKRIVAFGQQMKRIFAVAGRDRVHVITMDEFRNDPRAVYCNVLAFLGLPDDGRIEFPKINAAHAHWSRSVAKLWLSPPPFIEKQILGLRRHINYQRYPAVEWFKAWLNRQQARECLPRHVQAQVVDQIRDDVELLGNVLGMNLDRWGRVV